MLQTAAETSLTTSHEELPITNKERSYVFAAILAISKAIVSKMLDDKQDGLIIWVPRIECEIKDIPE